MPLELQELVQQELRVPQVLVLKVPQGLQALVLQEPLELQALLELA